jgi:hypothetical protein
MWDRNNVADIAATEQARMQFLAAFGQEFGDYFGYGEDESSEGEVGKWKLLFCFVLFILYAL